MNDDMIFDPFAEPMAEPCNCEKVRPEVIGRNIPAVISPECELYICDWCCFIRMFGMADALAKIEKKIIGERPSLAEQDADDFEDDSGLEDLEDWGAFSDEGIQAGCHSNCDYEMSETYRRECNEDDRMRRFFGATITFARESLNLSVKMLAEYLELPEYIIENLEAGAESITYKPVDAEKNLSWMRVAVPTDTERCERDKKWWEGRRDEEIEEKIRDFLLEYIGQ